MKGEHTDSLAIGQYWGSTSRLTWKTRPKTRVPSRLSMLGSTGRSMILDLSRSRSSPPGPTRPVPTTRLSLPTPHMLPHAISAVDINTFLSALKADVMKVVLSVDDPLFDRRINSSSCSGALASNSCRTVNEPSLATDAMMTAISAAISDCVVSLFLMIARSSRLDHEP